MSFPYRLKEVVLLYYYQGLSLRDIGDSGCRRFNRVHEAEKSARKASLRSGRRHAHV